MTQSQAIVLISVIISILTLGLVSALGSAKVENNASNSKQIGGHIPGYGTYQTTGSVLDPTQLPTDPKNSVVDPMKFLRDFNYGRVSQLSNGSMLREFTIVASDRNMKEISPGLLYNVWTFNNTVPGPTLRATEGDLVRIHFINNGTGFHTMHFHGIHRAEMDGVFEGIAPGGKFTYEFVAEPFGVFPYHCHIQPLEEHISHGLYGALIIDPKKPRANADEMIMIMNGYDTDFDTENNFYTVNGIPYYYMHHPIQIDKNKLIRVYLLNMLEFDPLNNFHLHANLFNFYKTGTNLVPDEYTDIVSMNQGERGILEFTYKFTGKYMFHAHKTEFAEKGWMGSFLVKEPVNNVNSSNYNNTNNVDANLASGGIS